MKKFKEKLKESGTFIIVSFSLLVTMFVVFSFISFFIPELPLYSWISLLVENGNVFMIPLTIIFVVYVFEKPLRDLINRAERIGKGENGGYELVLSEVRIESSENEENQIFRDNEKIEYWGKVGEIVNSYEVFIQSLSRLFIENNLTRELLVNANYLVDDGQLTYSRIDFVIKSLFKDKHSEFYELRVSRNSVVHNPNANIKLETGQFEKNTIRFYEEIEKKLLNM